MIDELMGAVFEPPLGPWIGGVSSLVGAVFVFLGAASSETPLFRYAVAVLLLHTAVVLIVGGGLGKGKSALSISWIVTLALFVTALGLMKYRCGENLCMDLDGTERAAPVRSVARC